MLNAANHIQIIPDVREKQIHHVTVDLKKSEVEEVFEEGNDPVNRRSPG